MTITRNLPIAAVATLAVWAFFSWPLPLRLASGIPATAQNTESQRVRAMIPGDHLQLLYHFELARDMATGRIPLFHNLYEFNTRIDADRYEPGTYYFPFSLVYAILAGLGGQAFGWNLTGLAALFATLMFTWRLVRRYVPGASEAAALSVLSILLPYRWVTLMGGSPTGLAMALVPMMLLGLDLAVRDETPWGGVLAGSAVVLAYCSDLHVFFFSVLALPAWCIVAFVAGRPGSTATGISVATCRRIALALLPTLLLVAAAYLLSRTTAKSLEEATMAGGWQLREVAPYSPRPAELFAWTGAPPVGAIYIGWVTTALLLAGLLCLVVRAVRRRNGRTGHAWLVLLLLCLAIVGIIALALGTNGPRSGLPLRICRKLIPPYRMIRQPAKIFCLLPSLLAVAGAMALAALTDIAPARGQTRFLRRAACVLVCGVLFLEYGLPIRSAICLLDRKQGAYQAVAADAEGRERAPLAVVIPLWPGNTHWSSVYLYDASLYRLRLMNGYRPAVPTHYVRDVFERFESINQGILTDNQLDNFLARGCHYILIHEDAFPEKVSPFPVYLTLKRLLHHPRLQLLEQDEQVRAFRILPAPDRSAGADTKDPPLELPYLFPARQWPLETPIRDELAIQPRAPVGKAPGLRWAVRLRGRGTLDYALHCDGAPSGTGRLDVDSAAQWQWRDIEIPSPTSFFLPRLTLSQPDGGVEAAYCVLDAGPKPTLEPGDSIEIPAACFFHAGYSDADLHNVMFRKERDPARPILYGTLIDLPDGTYQLTVTAQSPAPAPARLGTLRALNGLTVLAAQDVVADRPATIAFIQNNRVPVRIEFCYLAQHDVELDTFTLARPERSP